MYISENHNFCPFITRDATETASPMNTLCSQFAAILGAKVSESKPGSCSVEKDRKNVKITISGRPASIVVKGEFSYQSMDSAGRTLNLGEIALLQDEINRFITVLRKNGIDISAIHNHWIYDNPKLMYVHFQSIERPLEFARKVAEALKVIR